MSTGHILVLSTDPAFQASIDSVMREFDYATTAVATDEALFREHGRLHPDLVLLDVDAPDTDGLDICRRLLAKHGDQSAPVIFFATESNPTDIAAAFGAGAADFLAKTSTTDEIRARVRSHQQNYLLLKQQIAMAEQLSRANAAKNRFIGMAAHDMRNPLVSIRGFAEFLMDGTVGPMPPVQLALVSIIHGTSNLMIKTLNELLDVATIEAGQLKLQIGQHNLADLVGKAIAQAKIEARKKRARLDFTPPASPPVLAIDGDKIKQVFDNLLSNAIKFSPPASVISIAIEQGETSCAVVVRDQGPGLPEHIRTRFFERGSRAPFQPASEEKSAGIGLIICRNIVEAHHGAMTAQNQAEKGCEVRVTLPLSE